MGRPYAETKAGSDAARGAANFLAPAFARAREVSFATAVPRGRSRRANAKTPRRAEARSGRRELGFAVFVGAAPGGAGKYGAPPGSGGWAGRATGCRLAVRADRRGVRKKLAGAGNAAA
jgi:hypothetical protein